MKPWTWDADFIDFDKASIEEIDHQIVSTHKVKEFLKYDEHDSKYFIVAPKGVGKTLLLRAKSSLYRNNYSGFKFIPRTELVEKFVNNNTSFSKEDLDRFTDFNVWYKLWELSMLTLIMTNFDLKLPKEVEQIIGNANSLNDIVSAFLQNRGKIESIQILVPTVMRPLVRNISQNKAINQVAIFIDNIDESFDRHIGDHLARSNNVSQNIWINAQLGLMHVARDLNMANKHIRIFLALRSEAFNNSKVPVGLQVRNYTTFLTYSKDEVRDIFVQNIYATPKDRLASPDSDDPIVKFLGYIDFEHRFAKDHFGNPRREDLFDYLFRHTFGRPRELIKIGYELNQIDASRRDPNRVREKVNLESNLLFKQYKNEIVPYFRENEFNAFCEIVESNVISYKKAVKVSDYIFNSFGFKDIFSYFYRLGLVGIVSRDVDDNSVQSFLPVGEYTLGTQKIPEHPDHFVVHPSIDGVLRHHYGAHFYNRNNIIGNNYEFRDTKSEVIVHNHVHLGLNYDGMSILLPELSKNKKIALVLNNSKEFEKLYRSRKMFLCVGETKITFSVISNKTSEVVLENQIEEWINNGENIVLYNCPKSVIRKVLSSASTISATSFDSHFQLCISSVEGDTDSKLLYMCQRLFPSNCIKNINKWMKDNADIRNWKVAQVLVDKLMYNCEFFTKDTSFMIKVEAEKNGQIIFLNSESHFVQQSEFVVHSNCKEEDDFYSARQKIIVEGVYVLLKYIKNNEWRNYSEKEFEAIFNLFFDIQAFRVMEKTPERVLEKLFGTRSESKVYDELVRFAQATLFRFLRLEKDYGFIVQASYILSARRKRILPNSREYFCLVRKSRLFFDSWAVLSLRDLLEIQPLKKMYYSVFISYSYADQVFCAKVHDSLEKRGVHVFLFQKDNPNKPFNYVMEDEIGRYDKILFVASENSIRSSACHYELSRGREKLAKEWKHLFLPIRLDDFILSVKENDVPNIPDKKEYWDNIKEIQSIFCLDFSLFNNEKVTPDYELCVDLLMKEIKK